MATYWWSKAANRNYALAQYELGICYSWGFGVEKNDEDAAYWYARAANQGFATAQ